MTNYLMNLDWLTVNFLRSPQTEFENRSLGEFSIKKEPYTTRQFAEVYTVSWRGDDVASIVCNPFSVIISPLLVQVKLANHCFYSGIGLYVLQCVQSMFCLEYQSISRIDVCVDCNCFDLAEFMKHFRSGEYLITGKRAISEWYEMQHGKIDYNGVKFGKLASSYTFKIYDKTKEIEEESLKFYIRDWWRANGLVGEKIYRFEFSINDLAKFCNADGVFYTAFDYLASLQPASELFKRYMTKCRFYEAGTGSKPCRCKTVELVPYMQFAETQKVENVEIGSKNQTVKMSINLIMNVLVGKKKSSIQDIWSKIETVTSLSNDYGLRKWLRDKWGDELYTIGKQHKCHEYRLVWREVTDLFRSEFRYHEIQE